MKGNPLLAFALVSLVVLETPSVLDPIQIQATGASPVPGVAAIQVINATDSSRQDAEISGAVKWAIHRYERAGLELPKMTISFVRQRSTCGGFRGLWTKTPVGHHIDICTGGDLVRRRLLLHEMAHAWVADHLREADRVAFLTRRGLSSWNDKDAPWALRGAEQAAIIIAWGLEEDCEPPEDLAAEPADSLRANFARLTRAEPVCRTVNLQNTPDS